MLRCPLSFISYRLLVVGTLFICATCAAALDYSSDTRVPVKIPYAQDLNEEMLYYIFDWGDGTVAPSSLKRSGIRGFMTHRYREPGTYKGRYRAVSISGKQSKWVPFKVNVKGLLTRGAPVVGSRGSWRSRPSKKYWNRSACVLKLNNLYALDCLKVGGSKNFPTHFCIEYSINGGKTWNKLNSAQCFFFPNPGRNEVLFSFNGVVANAVRLKVTRRKPDESVSIGSMTLSGEKKLLFDCSERSTTIAALNNLWYAYGSAINEVRLDYVSWGQSKRPFESGVSYMGNAEWMPWDALEFSWTDTKELKELRAKWLDYPLDKDGFVWACPSDPRHLNNNRHYDNNACYINGIVHYFLQTGDRAFLDHVCTRTKLTNLAKLRLAMRYQLKQLGGSNGVLTITDPEIQGIASSKSGNYWDYYKFGHQSAFDNVEFFRSLLSMAKLERHLGNDAKAVEYDALAEKTKKKFNELFWNKKTGRYVGWIDPRGIKRDFGFTFVNQYALAYGLADEKRAKSVIDWLEGKRIVRNDTSTGKDIYHFGIAARANTLDMASAPEMAETWGGAIDPNDEGKYGLSMQNGGAIFYTSYYGLHARLRYAGINDAMKRLKEIVAEFEKDELRRMPSNHVGHTLIVGILLCFPESGLVPMFYLDGILGISPAAGGLRIAPNLPVRWKWASVKSYWFRDVKYSIRVDRAAKTPRIYGKSIIVPADGVFLLSNDGKKIEEMN